MPDRYFVILPNGPSRCVVGSKCLGDIPLAVSPDEYEANKEAIISMIGKAFVREVHADGTPVLTPEQELRLQMAIRAKRKNEIAELMPRPQSTIERNVVDPLAALKKTAPPKPPTREELWAQDPTGGAIKGAHMEALVTGDAERVAELEGDVRAIDVTPDEYPTAQDETEEPPQIPDTLEDDEDSEAGEHVEIPFGILDGSVAAVKTAISSIDDVEVLLALRDAEEDGKTRKGALAAIDERVAALGGQE